MDELGIYAQVIYPNLATFGTRHFVDKTDRELHTLCIQVYNDFLIEGASEAPSRFVPIACLVATARPSQSTSQEAQRGNGAIST